MYVYDMIRDGRPVTPLRFFDGTYYSTCISASGYLATPNI